MFDVLAYLVQAYGDYASCPAPEQLARKLTAEGFDDDEINEAFQWLAALDEPSLPEIFGESCAPRIFSAEECDQLPADCRGFIHFLDQSGGLSNLQRELLIDRLMAVPADELDQDAVRLLTLTVLWRYSAEIDALLADELMSALDGPATLQ